MSETIQSYDAQQFQPYADGFVVGDATVAYITRMREPVEMGQTPKRELLTGDILRRTCALGGSACTQSGCQAPEGFTNIDKVCSDLNLKDVVERLNIESSNMLMVGVTADNVGFYDQIDDYSDVNTNSVGIRELAGYNAFFARESEGVVLGARLADCGFAAIEFTDREGESVAGFVHLTRPNLQGESDFKFEVDGKPAGCFEYFMHEALEHYGADIDSVKIRVIAAIKAENFKHTFKDKSPEDLFPGWFAQGMLVNTSNPDWKPGDAIDEADVWEPQYREMLSYQIDRSGVDRKQVSMEGIIDPADLELGHASNHAGAHGKMPDARDAYLVMPRNLTK